jgi:hypothetical protein
VSFAPFAHAQSAAELSKARTEFKEGVSLEAAGDWAGALAKFQDVAKVKTTPQVRFHIGRCKEKLGRLNEALGEYRMAEYDAQKSKAKELPEITQAREALEARVPKLVITRGDNATAASIELDGVALGEAQVGKEVSVDPGPHRIVGKVAAGQFEQNVSVGEGETKNVELDVPPELLKKPAAATKDEEPEPTPEETPPEAPPEKKKSVLPYVIGAAGIVSLGASGYFYLQRNKAENDLNDVCRNNVCPKSKQSLQDDGKRDATLSAITLGVGVVGVGVAIVLLATGGKKQEKPQQAGLHLRVVPTPEMRGVNLVGSF